MIDELEIRRELAKPFDECDVEWRVQRAGFSGDKVWAMVLCYVTNRAVEDRLDDVFGVGGWENEYKDGPSGGIMCGLRAKIDGEWVTKWDGAENTNVEAVKGGFSGSMKRAAVQWGIGRYLYKLEATFAVCHTTKPKGIKVNTHRDKNANKNIYWETPNLPRWALPREDGEDLNGLVYDYQNFIKEEKALDLYLLVKKFDQEDPIHNMFKASFKSGFKTKGIQKHRKLMSQGYSIIEAMAVNVEEGVKADDDAMIVENWDDCEEVKKHIYPLLSSQCVNYLKERAEHKKQEESK